MAAPTSCTTSLSNADISRYSRQLILPEWGVPAQIRIKSLSVLIVGAGGLGCPAAQYLAAAGVGHIGILDYDTVEISNLHRQILHSEGKVGVAKVDSIRESILRLNSSVKVSTHHVLLSSNNALDIIKQYDIIVDASDNVATRYLVNDGCVLLNKPLVSGSALRFEGQLTIYHHGNGPCYRCLFPSPPPPNMVTNCSEGGVLGVVPGIIGSLQALEVLKIAANVGDTYSGRLLLYDGLSGTFRTIKLRGRDPSCIVCGDNPTITELIDYVQFCGSSANDKDKPLTVLDDEDRITCQPFGPQEVAGIKGWLDFRVTFVSKAIYGTQAIMRLYFGVAGIEYKKLIDEGVKHTLVDVRPTVEFDICHLDNSINVPLKSLDSKEPSQDLSSLIDTSITNNVSIYVVCRRGNDSQLAVGILKRRLLEHQSSNSDNVSVKDIIGGLTKWSEQIDKEFPKY